MKSDAWGDHGRDGLDTAKRDRHRINNTFGIDTATERDQRRRIVEAAKDHLNGPY